MINHYNIVRLKKYNNIISFIFSLYNDSIELQEALYRIRNNIFNRPTCKVCGKELQFKKYYSIYCSNSCQRKDPDNIKKLKETCIAKYGTDNPSKSKQVIDKAKHTCNEKYGGNSPMHSKDVVNKRTETNIKKYGVTVASKLNKVIQQSIYKRNLTKKKNNTFMNKQLQNTTELIYNKEDIIDELYIETDTVALNKEFMYYLDAKGKCNNYTSKNYIIKYFQQDNFYAYEKYLWTIPEVRDKLLKTIYKHTGKEPKDLTVNDVLINFKYSGIWYGYSHFNPLLFKWFIETYKIKTCYDPCGGWGHRLLGCTDLDLYIYNDLSTGTYECVKNMIHFFDMECITAAYNEDARTFRPTEEYEAMFTCPPYFNLEHYECGGFKDINDYENFVNSLFDCFNEKESCKIFGLVTRDDMLFSHTDYVEAITLKTTGCVWLSNKKEKKHKEYLYIFKK